MSNKEELSELREQLKDVPFEDVQRLKQKIGTKAFNEVFGFTSTAKSKVFKKKAEYNRGNKNRPREVSSRIPSSQARDSIQAKKKIIRDPRFDNLSGEFDKEIFETNYSFLDDIKQREKKELKKKLKKEENPEEKAKIKLLLKRMRDQELAKEQEEKKKALKKAVKNKEMQLIAEGKTPFHLKKSDRKKLLLAEKYKELKKSGKLDKYLERKRKKIAQKEKKKKPFTD